MPNRERESRTLGYRKVITVRRAAIRRLDYKVVKEIQRKGERGRAAGE